MNIVIPVVLALLFISALLILFIAYSRRCSRGWLLKPSTEGKFLNCNGTRIYYRVRGKNEPAVIIISDPGSSSAEWWPIQNEISNQARVICYERPGYSWSQNAENGSTLSLVQQIDALIKVERIKRPVLLVSSGASTVYARYYAILHPENVGGLLLINPLPLDHKRWMNMLSEFEEYVSPEAVAKKRIKKAGLGTYRLFSPLRGYKLDKRYRKIIVEHYTSAATYQSQLKELSDLQQYQDFMGPKPDFQDTPVWILYSGDEALVRENIRKGMPEYTARQVCRLYRELSRDFSVIADKNRIHEIEGCGGYLHLGMPKVLSDKILDCLKEIRH
jgi:pimeloyl-ACP methyl ester carboxylesterase